MALAIKYRVSGDFSLTTEIEPENIENRIDMAVSEIGDDFEGGSYFGTQSVTSDGGQFAVTVEADDEDEAESKVREALDEGFEFEDYNGFTWLVENLSFEVERLEEEPPTVEEAIEILRGFINRHFDSSGVVDDDENGKVARAAMVVLDDHSSLGQRITSLEARLEEATQRIDGLVSRVDEQSRLLLETKQSTDPQV